MENKAVVTLRILKRGEEHDLEVPLDISANDLVIGLNSAYQLGINTSDMKQCYLKSERPIALLKGNKSLSEYGIMNGSILLYTE